MFYIFVWTVLLPSFLPGMGNECLGLVWWEQHKDLSLSPQCGQGFEGQLVGHHQSSGGGFGGMEFGSHRFLRERMYKAFVVFLASPGVSWLSKAQQRFLQVIAPCSVVGRSIFSFGLPPCIFKFLHLG